MTAAVAPDADTIAAPPAAQLRRWMLVAVAALATGLIAGVLLWRTLGPATAGAASADQRILREAWGPLARPDANVLLCLATPLHLTVVPGNFRHQFDAPAEAYPRWRQHRPLAHDAKLGMVFTDNVIGFGYINAVLATTNTLRDFGSGYQVLPEHVSPVSAFRNRNVVLFGAPVDSEAATRLHENTPLVVELDPAIHEFVIRDRETGSTRVPEKDDTNTSYRVVYGLVTVLHNRIHDGRNLGMVMFSGITSVGSQGAAEYFSTPAAMRELKAGFPGGAFPKAYQVVVRCRYSNNLLLSYDVVDRRIVAN